jgi:hypothetical protein
MATEAARLKQHKVTGRKKKKTDLTHIGLLMEGVSNLTAEQIGSEDNFRVADIHDSP